MIRRFLICWLLLLTAAAGEQGAALSAGMRVWRDADGREMTARLVEVEEGEAVFRLEDGRRARFPLAKLSGDDRVFAEDWRDGAADVTAPFEMRTVRWPKVVDIPPRAIEVEALEDRSEDGRFVYRSGNFEFKSEAELAVSVMKDVSRAFEATYQLLDRLPWHVAPEPRGEFFEADLFRSRRSYIEAGGPPNSGGVYFPSTRKFMVPFASLGLEQRGERFFKSDYYDVEVLVHEITHMMMHDMLPFLPMWVVEGAAEYTSVMPYGGGRFQCDDADDGIRRYLKRYTGNSLRIAHLEGLLEITTEEWQERAARGEQMQLYAGSLILFYYFLHLENRGTGERMLHLLHLAGEEGKRWRRYDEAYERHWGNVTEKLAAEGIEPADDGIDIRVLRRIGLTDPPKPPEPGGYSDALRSKHIAVLLDDREEVEILADLKERYRSPLRIFLE